MSSLSFHILVVLLALNLVVAFIIESMRHTFAAAHHHQHDTSSEKMQQKLTVMKGGDGDEKQQFRMIAPRALVVDPKLELFKQELQSSP